MHLRQMAFQAVNLIGKDHSKHIDHLIVNYVRLDQSDFLLASLLAPISFLLQRLRFIGNLLDGPCLMCLNRGKHEKEVSPLGILKRRLEPIRTMPQPEQMLGEFGGDLSGAQKRSCKSLVSA